MDHRAEMLQAKYATWAAMTAEWASSVTATMAAHGILSLAASSTVFCIASYSSLLLCLLSMSEGQVHILEMKG